MRSSEADFDGKPGRTPFWEPIFQPSSFETFRAQQPERMRRIGVLFSGFSDTDPEPQARVEAFRRQLQDVGWIEGRAEFDRAAGVDPIQRRLKLNLSDESCPT
jgi:hypothetical protein